MSILRMADLDLAGKRVLIREDLNVPVKDGVITSEQRITAALPTIRLALEKGAAVMVTSHLGRPKEGTWTAEDSLAPVAARLGELLGREVPLVKVVTTIGKPGVAVAAITRRPHGYVVALVEGATKPTINGSPIGTEAINLRHGDLLELAGTQMQFIQQ